MRIYYINRYIKVLFAVILAGAVLFETGYYLGTKHSSGQGILAIPGSEKSETPLNALLMAERRALTGVVKEINNDVIVVTEEGGEAANSYSFRTTTATQVTQLVPLDKTEQAKSPLAQLFPYQAKSVMFSDIKVGDRVFILSEDPIPQGTRKVLPLLEVKIQP